MSERILVVSRHFWPEDYRINDLCVKLTERGFKVDVLCGQPSDSSGEFMKGYGSMKVRRETFRKMSLYRALDVKQGTGSNLRVFLNYLVFPISSNRQVKDLFRNTYSAVLVYQLSPVMMCRAAFRLGKQKRIPVYVYVAQLWPQSVYSVLDVQSNLFKKLLYRLSMHYYQKADKLILPFISMRRYFSDRLALPDDQLPVVPMSPDAVYEREIPDDTLREKLAGSFNLVMIGDFDGQICVDTLLKTAIRIRLSEAWNVRFIVVGDSGKIRELQDRAQQQGLADLFFFEGAVPKEQIGKYLYIADALVGIIRPDAEYEYTIPHQVINYLAAGKPLVISMGGAMRSLIKEAECGFYSEPEDADTLFHNLMKLYRMDALERSQMGQQGLSYQMKTFDRDRNADAIAAILRGESTGDSGESESTVKRLWEM